MRSLAAVVPTRVLPSCTKQQQLTSTRHRRVTARCVSSDDEDRRRRSVATTSSRAIATTSILSTSPAAASSIDDIAAASLSLQGGGIEAGDVAIVAGAAAAGVALIAGVANAISRSASSNGNASRKATSIPNATPNLRTKGASDDSRRRNYLIAPPPLFPLVPAFARQTYRYDTAPSRK
ncbi:hypothetical protein N9M16_02120 [Candidatus Dependentiae bacterium]|nr:hypothetical protein [Candidatus Dependentiae bacterium]